MSDLKIAAGGGSVEKNVQGAAVSPILPKLRGLIVTSKGWGAKKLLQAHGIEAPQGLQGRQWGGFLRY